MWLAVAALVSGAAFFAAVARQGWPQWPSVQITFGAPEPTPDEVVEKTPCIGFALPVPVEGDDDDDFAEDRDRR